MRLTLSKLLIRQIIFIKGRLKCSNKRQNQNWTIMVALSHTQNYDPTELAGLFTVELKEATS